MAGAVWEGDIVHERAAGTLSTITDEALASRWLHMATRWSVVVLLALLPLPVLLGEGAGSIVIVGVFAAMMALLGRIEHGEARRTFLQLAVIGLALRGVVLLLIAWLQAASGAVVLGPDGVGFLRAAQTILNAGFSLPRPSYEMFATYDTAHIYLFAGIIATLGPSMLNLHVSNCALTALMGPLTFSWVRLIAPRAALPAGLLVTFYPSLIYLAATDLWKDPSVITATTLGLWALVHIVHGNGERGRLVAFAAVAVMGLWYVHTSRFYALWYLEVGVAVMAVVGLLRGWAARRSALVAVLAAFVLAEAGPMLAGWPSSPVYFVASIAQATNAESLRYFSAGLLDRAADGSEAEGSRGQTLAQLEGFDLDIRGQDDVLQVDVDTALAAPGRFGPAGAVIQVIRRVWGPFVWVPPPAFTPRAVLGGDYLLYPGMLFWYALLPWMLAGLAVTGWNLVLGRTAFMLGAVWIFAVLYWAQFVVINLPYRQREALFPVLAIFAWLGFEHTRHRPWARKAYAGYWLALVALAAAHTVTRMIVAR
jgi:hypothetical protein